MPTEGKKAPDFSLPDADMEMFSLSSQRGLKHVVLFFYPKDDTPGCTTEAAEFSDYDSQFAEQDCIVVGLNRDDYMKHAAFRDKHGLAVGLLSDEDGAVCKRYGVLQEREVDGVMRLGVARTTFVIDKAGIVRQVYTAVTPRGHALSVLNFVRTLNN